MANPAGGGANPPDLSSLQDNFSQQQVGCGGCCCWFSIDPSSDLCFVYVESSANVDFRIRIVQAKITALKELVRQSEATQGRNNASAQEKVKNIAQRLTHLKTKASRARGGGVGEGKKF